MHLIPGILLAIVLFAVLVIVHEGGHFLTAKAFGVRVNEFSVGMGPLIFQKKKGDTEYSVRAIPVGGYVAMEGENGDSEDVNAFNNKPWWARALVLFAGPFMNLVLAVVVLAGLVTYMGTGIAGDIGSVKEDSPAYQAGIRTGDVITCVNGTEYEPGLDVAKALNDAASGTDETIDITYVRDGENVDVTVPFETDDQGERHIGVSFRLEHNVLVGLKYGVIDCVKMEKLILDAFASLFSGQGSMDDVAGPVGIVNVVDQTAQTGVFNLLYLLALLSINLGLVNLFPFPALDGGRLLFVFIRLFTGKAITDEMESKVHYLGIVVLFSFMIMITFHDVARIFTQ